MRLFYFTSTNCYFDREAMVRTGGLKRNYLLSAGKIFYALHLNGPVEMQGVEDSSSYLVEMTSFGN